MSEIINITQVNPVDFNYQEYSLQDETLISSFLVSSSFSQTTDNIELFLFDFNKNIIVSNYEYSDFSLLNNEFLTVIDIIIFYFYIFIFQFCLIFHQLY